MRKVLFVTGLRDVGKSRYITEHYPTADRVDLAFWWDNLPEAMDAYEGATWTKMLGLYQLVARMEAGKELITVELTGMSKPNQAAIHAMLQAAWWKGYEVEIVYLKPRDWNAFVEVIGPEAMSMFREYSRARKNNGGRWREPDHCPFFKDVKVIEVDHTSWPLDREDRWETLEVVREP
jgi:hypothetical protein